MPNPMSRREQIARIVDHEGYWERLDNLNAVIKSGICSDDQHMELCHVRDEEIAGTEESLTKADAILSLPSEHEGLVGELREALSEIAGFKVAGAAGDRGSYQRGYDIGFNNAGLVAAGIAQTALAKADQALTARGGDEGTQGLTTSRARPEGDVLAGKEG